MPSNRTEFTAVANANGSIVVSKPADVPWSVKVNQLTFSTNSGCSGRNHSIRLNCSKGETRHVIFDGDAFSDCSALKKNLGIKFSSGTWNFEVEADGFAPNEQVNGNCTIDWSIPFGPFSIAGAEIEPMVVPGVPVAPGFDITQYFDLRLDQQNNILGIKIGQPILANEIRRIGKRTLKDTRYEGIELTDLRPYGISNERNGIGLDLTIHYRKDEDYPWPIKGTFRTLDVDILVDGYLCFFLQNDQFAASYTITKTSSDHLGGIGGLIIGVFDVGFWVLDSISGGKGMTFSQLLLTIGAIAANVSMPELQMTSDCIEKLRSNKIIWPDSVSASEGGIWFNFRYDPANIELLLALISQGHC